jgi:hypothetical protein
MWVVYWLLLERSIREERRNNRRLDLLGLVSRACYRLKERVLVGGGGGMGLLGVGRHGGEIWSPFLIGI